ncbi:sugar phosphate isomerase/epimerase [Flavobacterium circumlabens]|uniref:Sugar phosphate isomerase/epimerase n=1 Tax=Flavobacterium circumlabens TaxID=2133765 RepID=A0A4Y7UEQ2_9FLAO|nr:sugar phosphate isomerase/epimerase [Flavobacterium circumlabens]TCN59542.1 sugar phosphate isomerase/epimerase [Flavobacterium circumlabens]TEB44834.1 sugar phosphate isomerase/epimerase [Flavobacterium circumlabens]
MQIKFFCPRWGSESLSWVDFCSKVKKAGYDGVESPVSLDEQEKKEMKTALDKYELLFIGQYYQSFNSDLEIHKTEFKKHLYNILELDPLLIDSQTGKDYFTAEQNRELFELASFISKESDVIIAHETHRNKALFAAHIAMELLNQNPDVLITADFSHWCNVSESLLEQQETALKTAIERTVHIHSRVGHSQAAQVSDPRAKAWTNELETHLNWWDQIIVKRAASKANLLTITPEFGPYPYMPALPFTDMPIANQWDINLYMMNLLKDRYKKYIL